MALTDSCADPARLSPRGVSAGCYQPLLPAGPSRRYLSDPSLVAWTPVTAVRGVHVPVSSSTSSAFPRTLSRSAFAFARQNDFLTDPFFETAVISLCSGPQLCSPPDRSPGCSSLNGDSSTTSGSFAPAPNRHLNEFRVTLVIDIVRSAQ